MKSNMTIIFLASIFFLSFTAGEASAFRCGNGLVGTGDTKAQVLNTCGKPTSQEKRCKQSWTTKKQKCDKKVEVWYYNCGDNDFIYALTFENNTLTGENTEGRGSGRSGCMGK
ncbi:MAG: DUF2845 domain-containing protein [Deltaproteobacteria bacterium]|nr:DUF2845 domain-containing protein [Deltaproteobacteria bacterium]